jgi:putative iron-only hydrogenase system regulator
MEQETRIAVVGIIVENKEAVGEVNQILHDYSPYIIGRMGLPYEKKHVNIISVIVDAPADRISALSGKLGKIRGISDVFEEWAVGGESHAPNLPYEIIPFRIQVNRYAINASFVSFFFRRLQKRQEPFFRRTEPSSSTEITCEKLRRRLRPLI